LNGNGRKICPGTSLGSEIFAGAWTPCADKILDENVLQYRVRPNKLIKLLPLAIAFFDETKRLENLARNWKEEGRHLVLLFRPTSHATAKPWPNQSSTQSRQAQIMHFLILLL
jgi:hypothetical protein